MDFNKFFQSKSFKQALWAIGGIVILLMVFQLGIVVGFKKASYSFKWGENYYRNIAGPRRDFFPDMGNRDFMAAHGDFGTILKNDGSSLVVKGNQGLENIILLNDKTIINRFRENIKPSDLKVGEQIVVIGSPNGAGQIEAKLIRVLPPPPPNGFPGFNNVTSSNRINNR